MTLQDYLDLQAGRRFVWGESDCVAFGLQWARARTGRPLQAFFEYASRDQAAQAIAARGGLEAIVTDWMDRNGFAPTQDPDDGDLGLAPARGGCDDSIAGCAVVIRCGPWWIGKAPRGIASVAAKGIPAWRIV